MRAGIVRRPEDYPYSSYPANALGNKDHLVTPHEVYLSLVGRGRSRSPDGGSEPLNSTGRNECCGAGQAATPTPVALERYRSLFDETVSRSELTLIRRVTEKGLGIGQAEFLLRVAKLISGSESLS